MRVTIGVMMGRSVFGTVQELKTGYRGRYRLRGRAFYTPVRPTKRAVRSDLAAIHTSIADGTWRAPGARRNDTREGAPNAPLYLREWYELWISRLRELGRSPNTIRSYGSSIKAHVLPVIGDKRVRDLTSADLQAVIDGMGELTPKTKTNVLRALTAMLSRVRAVDRPLVVIEMPVIPKAVTVKRQRRALTATQLDTVIAAADSPALAAAFVLAGWCCLRSGEVSGLQVGDIDREAWTVTVARAVKRGPQGAPAIGPPKSDRAYRTVSIPPRGRAVVAAHLDALGDAADDAVLFPGGRGGFTSDRVLLGGLTRACARAGVPRTLVHELRHTGLTLYGLAGATVAELMARAGHADAKTAMIYQHASAARDRELAERLG